MKYSINFKLSSKAAVLLTSLATFALSSQANENWMSTQTKVHNVNNAAHVSLMQSGAPLKIVVSMKLRNESNLDEYVANAMKSHTVGQLTSEQFMVQYAPTVADTSAVVEHLSKNGFKNIVVSKNRLLVSAEGTAGSVQNAFHTEMHLFNINGRVAHANASDVQVPKSLAPVVLAVHGLQNVSVFHTFARRLTQKAQSPASRNSSPTSPTGDSVRSVKITNFPAIYNATSLPSATNGNIAIITAGDMTQTVSDLNSFATSAGFPTPTVKVVTVGNGSSDTSGTDEWNMDTQASLAAAGGTVNSMILYAADSLSDADITAAYNQAVSDNTARAINVSLGECETDAVSSGVTASNDAIFKTAVAQGQTFSVSSGDSGSFECGGTTSAQSYPSVSPYVISLGGTTLSTARSGNKWAGESVWSCSSSDECAYGGGTGGGVSLTEPAPSWQIDSGVLGTSTQRGVPDISFDADPSSGALVLIDGENVAIGGTSLSAPLFTGFWTQIQSAKNNALPFPAATIYQNAAANPSWFNDITSGTNGDYSAKAGWDYVTGFGSVNIANFASGL